jgi:hypothetical protein
MVSLFSRKEIARKPSQPWLYRVARLVANVSRYIIFRRGDSHSACEVF